MFKDEVLNRIEKSGKYFINRIYECLKGVPTEEEIDDYLELVKKGKDKDIEALLKKHTK